MKPLLFLLVLVSFCTAELDYTVKEKNDTYELREYLNTVWLTTKMESPGLLGFLGARSRLQKIKGYVDAWPVLVTVRNNNDYRLSWFVTSGTNPDVFNQPVQLEHRAKFTVYVRRIDGPLTVDRAQQERRQFCQDLNVSCETYSGVGYGGSARYAEIWIYKTL